MPIPGDGIMGQLKRDQGLVVHADDYKHAKRLLTKEPDRWIDVTWGDDLNRRFDTRIRLSSPMNAVLARLQLRSVKQISAFLM
jgi:GTP pyrophosphokinase